MRPNKIEFDQPSQATIHEKAIVSLASSQIEHLVATSSETAIQMDGYNLFLITFHLHQPAIDKDPNCTAVYDYGHNRIRVMKNAWHRLYLLAHELGHLLDMFGKQYLDADCDKYQLRGSFYYGLEYHADRIAVDLLQATGAPFVVVSHAEMKRDMNLHQIQKNERTMA